MSMSPEHAYRRIYHIVGQAEWEDATARGVYQPRSLTTEGFIHCSTVDQVAGVARALYADQEELLMLHLDVELIAPEIRYEGEPEAFPHIYGPLELAAVLHVQRYAAGDDGRFPPPDPWDTAAQ